MLDLLIHVAPALLLAATAAQALRLAPLAGRAPAWTFLTAAFALLLLFEVLALLTHYQLLDPAAFERSERWIVLGITVLMVVGVFLFREIFGTQRLAGEQLRVMGAAALDAVIVVDHRGAITSWNPAAERLFGHTAEEALGRPLHQLIIPERLRAQAEQGFRRFEQTGEGPLIGKTVELTGLKRNGEEFAGEHSISALRIDGRWHALGIVRDVTARKAAQARLEQQLDELRCFEKVTVGRELRIQELAQENRSLKAKLAGLGRS
ncbi:MAG: PAS domain S-box protein [Gammaproteobacteria bacterium]